MSISQDSTATIVCREVFDETSLPTQDEIIDFAKRLGIDPVTEPHLLDIAREGIIAPLPNGWIPVQMNDGSTYYYFHKETKETSWEHPLDGFYKEKVRKAREKRRLSTDDEDSKTTAKDLESHEEATLGKEPIPSTSFSVPTRIPKKLPPIQFTGESSGAKKKETKRTNEASNQAALLANRASRDYTNLKYSDPSFFKSPKILESSEAELSEVLKRSESMSPRVEEDWAQLSRKFDNEEKVIDIDRLSVLDNNRDVSGVEEKGGQSSQRQTGLTLSGGGATFLKSNRSGGSTPMYGGGNVEDFGVMASGDDGAVAPDRLKSILRDKEDEKSSDKSVRFDLERRDSINFDYDSSGNDSESEEKQNILLSFSKKVASAFNFTLHQSGADEKDDVDDRERKNLGTFSENFVKTSKKVGSRFTVLNVSEKEHISQMSKSSSNEFDDESYPGKFANVRKIDILSKSDADLEEHADTREKIKERNFLLSHLDDRKNLDIETEIKNLIEEYGDNIEALKGDLERRFLEQKSTLESRMHKNLSDIKSELADEEELEIKKMIEEMEAEKKEHLEEVRNELESCYEKERQDILSNLKVELDQRKRELLGLRNLEMSKLEVEHEESLNNEKKARFSELEMAKEHSINMEIMKNELEKEYEELKKQIDLEHQNKISKVVEEHENNLAKILRDYKIDENLTRKVYKQRLEEINNELSKDLENETKKLNDRAIRHETIEYEKMRCEKRLLEDKYNTLKEKYLKLKREVRLVIEKKHRKKEQGHTTASETEKSNSIRTKTDLSDQKSSPRKSRSNSRSQECPLQKHGVQEENSEGSRIASGSQSAGDGTKNAAKFESDDTTTASETYSNILKKKKIFTKKMSGAAKSSNASGNHVENIRKQLEKLEDLGDLLPSNDTAYHVRYPFHDKTLANMPSELEFFRHRIHLERDSVRRAREALKQQKSAFQGRQRAWKQRSARATLEQLVKEERELSDMEVTLHRTRSLLGEKVIHLRHLEQSLDRVTSAKKSDGDATPGKNEDMTLSDMSSASSGFSSTDFCNDLFIDKPDEYLESTKIIQSLENLNSEIREIWSVLNKRQDNNIPPPPALMFSDMSWLPYQQLTAQPSGLPASALGTPHIQSNILSQLTAAHSPATTAHNIISQYGPNSGFTTSVGTVDRLAPNLIERTRNLRDWLRQARIESSDLINPGEATL